MSITTTVNAQLETCHWKPDGAVVQSHNEDECFQNYVEECRMKIMGEPDLVYLTGESKWFQVPCDGATNQNVNTVLGVGIGVGINTTAAVMSCWLGEVTDWEESALSPIIVGPSGETYTEWCRTETTYCFAGGDLYTSSKQVCGYYSSDPNW